MSSAINNAIISDDLDVFKKLLTSRKNEDPTNYIYSTIKNNSVNIFKHLFEILLSENISNLDEMTGYALNLAISVKSTEIFKIILPYVNFKNFKVDIHSVNFDENLETLGILFKNGLGANGMTLSGFTPCIFLRAIYHKQIKTLELIVTKYRNFVPILMRPSYVINLSIPSLKKSKKILSLTTIKNIPEIEIFIQLYINNLQDFCAINSAISDSRFLELISRIPTDYVIEKAKYNFRQLKKNYERDYIAKIISNNNIMSQNIKNILNQINNDTFGGRLFNRENNDVVFFIKN